MTVGQKAVDRDYAKHYNTFTQRGIANSKAAINRLEKLADEMEKDTGIGEAGGGRFAPLLHDSLRSRDAIRRRDNTRNAANTTLKELFGGGLSDAEREAAAKEYYNDNLDNKTNAKILRDKIKQLKSSFDSELKKAKYYEKNNTLSGFSGASNENESDERNSDVQGYANEHFNGNYSKAELFLRNRGDIK